MPPKKVKKTKKQIEEEKKKLEEEKRILEELEKKKADEEEVKQRIAEEKRRVEEEKRRAEEEKRLNEEWIVIIERDGILRENRETSFKSKKKDLDPKFLLCDPLPDPENEKDLTSFITIWKEQKDKSLKECIDQCQISEDVIRTMQSIFGEALSNYNFDKTMWCRQYMQIMRDIILEKYDKVSAYILEYIENHTKITQEELDKQNKQSMGNRKIQVGDLRSEFYIKEASKDIKFGIYGNVQGKSQLHKPVDFDGFSCRTPRQHANQQIIIRALWTSFDYVTGPQYYPDIVVGGIIDFRLYQYPEGPKSAMKWTMRNVFSVDDRLKNIPYPDPTTQIQTDPINIIFILPENVFISENDEIKVGVWDDKEKQWVSELIDDLSLDKTSRKLEFTTRKLSQMAYLQSRCTDYPYKSWKLRCVENEKAVLDIETKRISLSFEIGVDYLMLVDKSDPELKDLINKKFVPGNLLIELSKCGIHIMPVDDDAKLGGIQLKSGAAEEKAILDIATSVRSFAYRSCKWNKTIDSDNIVIKIRENLEFDREFFEDHEPDWKYVMWWPNKVGFVRCSDDADQCDLRLAPNHETHAVLNISLQGGAVTDEAYQRSSQYSYIDFIDTVRKTLRLTRILSFT